MEFIIEWTNCIISVTVLFTIVELIIPDGNQKKTILMVAGLMTTIVIATPVINLLNKNFDMTDVFCDISEIVSESSIEYDNILENQVENLQQEYSTKIINDFNNKYPEMVIDECKVSFQKDNLGKIIDVERIEVVTEFDDANMKANISKIAEISEDKIIVLVMPKEE